MEFLVEAEQLNNPGEHMFLASYLEQYFPGGMSYYHSRLAIREITKGAEHLETEMMQMAIVDSEHIVIKATSGNDFFRRGRFYLVYSPAPAPVPAPAPAQNASCMALGAVLVEMMCGEVLPATIDRARFCADFRRLLDRKLAKPNKDRHTLPKLKLMAAYPNLIDVEMAEPKLRRKVARVAFYARRLIAIPEKLTVDRHLMEVIRNLFNLGAANVNMTNLSNALG